MSNNDLVENAKRLAAYRAVDNHVKVPIVCKKCDTSSTTDCFSYFQDGVIGIGSGSTVVYAVERLAQRVKEEGLNVICVPSSFQAKQLIIENNLVLGDLERQPEVFMIIFFFFITMFL